MPRDKDVAKLIRENPGCVARIDNDSWTLYRADPSTGPDDDAWHDANVLAEDSDAIQPDGSGFDPSSPNTLLAIVGGLVGLRVEGV